jgi:hypothetical protein
MFRFSILPVQHMRPRQPLFNLYKGWISYGIKRPESEADHAPPSNTEVNNRSICLHFLSGCAKRIYHFYTQEPIMWRVSTQWPQLPGAGHTAGQSEVT